MNVVDAFPIQESRDTCSLGTSVDIANRIDNRFYNNFDRQIYDNDRMIDYIIENRHVITNSKFIDQKIDKGLNYLYENQFPSGEFPTYLSLSHDMSNIEDKETIFGNVPIIFDTGLILHTLNLADNKYVENMHSKMIYKMKNNATNFLLDNKESHSVWRFFGKNHYIPPDVDDTSVVFASLVESGTNMSNESLDYMLNYRNSNGIFYVWINSEEWLYPSNPFYNKQSMRLNEIDPGVNTNALYAYSLRKRTQNDVINYLNDMIENESFVNGSSYYPSPYILIYLITKAYSDGNVKELDPSIDTIKRYLLKTQDHDGGWKNDINTALATTSLINLNYRGKHLKKAIEHILNNQNENGSWDIYSVYTQPGDALHATIYFGSYELTTSFSIESLIKYKNYIRHRYR